MKKFYFMMALLLSAVVANAQDVYLRGAHNGWGTGNEWKFAQNGTTWTLEVPAASITGEFKIADANWGTINLGGGGTNIQLGKEVSLSQNGGNMKLGSKGDYSKLIFTVTNKTKLVVTGSNDEVVVTYPEKVYLLGHIDGITAWAPNSAVTVASIGEGVYKAVDVTIANSGDGYGYFAFAENKSANASDWDGLGTRYGAASEDALVEVGGEYKMVKGTNSWKLAVGMYDLTLDLVNSKLFVSESTTAIDEVAADNAAVEYYNLQGVKVANPENGIFIKKQGNKVAKVVL